MHLGSRTIQHENIRYSHALTECLYCNWRNIYCCSMWFLCDNSIPAFTFTADKQVHYSRSIHDDKQNSSVFHNHYLPCCLMILADLTVMTDPMLFTWGKEWGWYNYHHHYQFPAYTTWWQMNESCKLQTWQKSSWPFGRNVYKEERNDITNSLREIRTPGSTVRTYNEQPASWLAKAYNDR